MFKTVNFNIYEEHLEDVVYGEKNTQEKRTEITEIKEETDKPIPKPPPQFWTDSLGYRRFNRESEGSGNV